MRFSKTFCLVVFVALFGSALSFAESVRIPRTGVERPAVDLVYQGRRIDLDEAAVLASKGFDLSTLDPVPSDVWKPEGYPAIDQEMMAAYPADAATVNYREVEFSLSSRETLRSLVDFGPYEGQDNRKFYMTFSLKGHSALMNSALLRRLGYLVPTPKRYKKLTVRFETSQARDRFIDDLSRRIVGDPGRWKPTFQQSGKEATFEDVILEPAEIDGINYHWATLRSDRQVDHLKGRRAQLALIIPYVLAYIPESVNLYSYESGKILNDGVVLTHPIADVFKDSSIGAAKTTYQDARWILRRLAKLSKDELREVVDAAQFPPEVAALILEKITARRNNLIELFGLDSELPATLRRLPYVTNLSVGAVKDGKLTQDKFDGYASRFSYGDPESPLRTDELARYGAIEGIGYGLGLASSEITKRLALSTQADLAKKHFEKLQQDLINHFLTNPTQPYKAPVATFGGVVGGLSVNASRNVVSGTYYGNDSKVQLVDQFSFEQKVGWFQGYYQIPNLPLQGEADLSHVTTYLHVRPVTDMKGALKTNWLTVIVPTFMAQLNKLLNPDEADFNIEIQAKGPNGNRKIEVSSVRKALQDGDSLKSAGSVLRDFVDGEKKLIDGINTVMTKIGNNGYTVRLTAQDKDPFKLETTGEVDERTRRELSQELKRAVDETSRIGVRDGAFWVVRGIDVLRNMLSGTGGTLASKETEQTIAQALSDFAAQFSQQKPELVDRLAKLEKDPAIEEAAFQRSFEAFLNELQPDESFSVTNSLRIGGAAQVQIPLTGLMVQDPIGLQPSIGLGTEGTIAHLRRTTFVRTKDGMHVYLQRANSEMIDFELNFNWVINLLKLSQGKKFGQGTSRAFLLDPVPTDAKEYRKWLAAMRDLIRYNNSEKLESQFPSYALKHDISAEIGNGKFLLWRSYNLEESHRLTVEPPKDPDHDFNPKDKERVFFSHRIKDLVGTNYFSFISDLIGGFKPQFGMNPDKYGTDPSGSPLGSSAWTQAYTDAEVTSGASFDPVALLEHHWSGWNLSKQGMFEILDGIEERVKPMNFEKPIFRRDEFATMENIQLYEIQSTWIVYSPGMAKIRELMFPKGGVKEFFEKMLWLSGNQDPYYMCKARRAITVIYNPKDFSANHLRFSCEQAAMIGQYYKAEEGDEEFVFARLGSGWRYKLLELRDHVPTDPEKLVEWYSKVMYYLEGHALMPRLAEVIGKENYFFQARVSGFRTHDENGDTEYMSDSIGNFDNKRGAGAFSEFATKYKIKKSEVYATYLTEGF